MKIELTDRELRLLVYGLNDTISETSPEEREEKEILDLMEKIKELIPKRKFYN
jgi:hypothetical protein